jgi:hypothetical protein
MKFTVTFKTPSVIDDSILEALDTIEPEEGWGDDGSYEVAEEELRGVVEEYVKFGEYVTIEFDTNTNSATVLKAKHGR